MRADARRNRQVLLEAATELILEVGGAPPRDAIAQRAGVGIGTLYRHYPDQQMLLRAVAIEILDRAIEHGEQALAASSDGAGALRRYLHAAVDVGLGAVNILHPLLDDVDWPDQRAAAQDLLGRLVDGAVRAGEIGTHVTVDEIGLAAIRFCRPLAVGLGPTEERAIAHHQLDHYLDGLAHASTPSG